MCRVFDALGELYGDGQKKFFLEKLQSLLITSLSAPRQSG